MHIVLMWFSDGTARPDTVGRAQKRFDAAVGSLVAPTYARHDAGGDDWGLTVLHPNSSGGFRWPVLANDGDVTAVSLGVPVGLDPAPGPVGLARRLLSGGEVLTDVLPPFGLIAQDSDRVAIQQDWIGMCRLFTGSADGVTAFCSRPTLLANFLSESVLPDLDGWASYSLAGFFGADSAPVRGVRLLNPGERVVARRRSGGGWDLDRQTGHSVDDLVTAGLAARGRSDDAALDLAAHGFTTTMSTLRELYSEQVTLGLSGGKDSRLIAASMISAGWLPKLQTNEDLRAEGETARKLVEILAESRGLHPEHRLFQAGAADTVHTVGLIERVQRLHRRFDFQYPSSYAPRAAVPEKLADRPGSVSISGVGGELATGYWYPRPVAGESERQYAERALAGNMLSALPVAAAVPEVLEGEKARIGGIIDHALEVGLRGPELIDYVYLVERVRRWYSSAYTVGTVTPYLAPAFVTASFAVTPPQKTDRLLHEGLLRRYMPEWADVPYVAGAVGSTATRVWEGDGVPAMCELLDTAGGDIAGLVLPEAVECALARCVAGAPQVRDRNILQQFAALAVASRTLEPDAVRPATGEAQAKVNVLSTQPEVLRPDTAKRAAGHAPGGGASQAMPAPLAALAVRLRFIKRSRVGQRVWGAVRKRVVG